MTNVIATVYQFHQAWAWCVIIANGVAGLWTLAAAKWPTMRTRALWWFIVLAETAILVQIVLGLTLLAQGYRAPFFHYFYGIVATVVIALLFFYRAKMKRKRFWIYGFGGVFLMGLGIRAMMVVLLG